MRIVRVILLFVLTTSHNELSNVSSAIIPPRSPSFWNGDYRRDGDDVPIVGDNIIIRRNQRGKRRRRRPKSNDSDDNDAPPFFYDQEYDIDWREQYEFDKLRRRRHRHINRKENEAEYGPSSPWNTVRQWTLAKTGIRIPRINFHFDPITILKLRKSWHNIVPGAIVRVGADFETQHRLGGGVWRLRGCLEDKILGGRFTMKGKRNGDRGVVMEYAKSWLFAGTGELDRDEVECLIVCCLSRIF
jgi:hypothetical protein